MKKILISILVILGLSLSAFCQKNTKPNVVLILADDLGYNDLSCYRALFKNEKTDKPPTAQTPNIDKLAKSGMMFTDFYCGSAVCSPSRSALMTGRNATRVGIYNWIPDNSPMHMRGSENTIAEMLKSNGYQTGHFGKWHLTSKFTNQPLPNNQGFDYSFYAYNNAEPSHLNPKSYYRNGIELGEIKGYACDIVENEATTWLEKNISSEKPFFIDVWFNEPHVVVAAPEEFTQKHAYNAAYYGAIENMDRAVGRLMKYLEDKNLLNNTIVIFTSDNGSQWDNSNYPLRGEKCFNFEGGIRVPFIVSWLNHIQQNQINTFNGSFTDVLPTLAAIVKNKQTDNHQLDGIDISKVFYGKKLKRDEPIFFFRYFHDPILMIREGNWCLLGYQKYMPFAPTLDESALANIRPWHFQKNHQEYLETAEPTLFELYNLKEDMEQRKDLSKKYPKKVDKMKAKMLSLRKEMINEGGDWYQ